MEARQVIADGKMAVTLGIEPAELFGCYEDPAKRPGITCDGTWHVGTWQITGDPSVPGYEYGFGSLKPGAVYVQFCWDGPGDPPAWHAYSEQFAHAAY